MAEEQKKLSKCCAEPVREMWGTKLLVSKGNIQKAATCFYQCTHCGKECPVSYLVRNQYGVWETDKKNGRPEKGETRGRPSELTSEVVKKLEEVFSYDPSVTEICTYLHISRQTFYNWKEQNPELFDTLEELRAKPLLRARKTVVDALETNTDAAFRYLERKSKKEFAPHSTIQTEEHIVRERDISLEEMLKRATPEQRENLLNGLNEIHGGGN